MYEEYHALNCVFRGFRGPKLPPNSISTAVRLRPTHCTVRALPLPSEHTNPLPEHGRGRLRTAHRLVRFSHFPLRSLECRG